MIKLIMTKIAIKDIQPAGLKPLGLTDSPVNGAIFSRPTSLDSVILSNVFFAKRMTLPALDFKYTLVTVDPSLKNAFSDFV